MAKEKGYNKRVDFTSDEKPAAVSIKSSDDSNLLFGRKNYMLILAGIGLIFIGMLLMIGGHMPSPDVWDESLIYSPVRITLAPMVILAGLGVEVYAIFAKK